MRPQRRSRRLGETKVLDTLCITRWKTGLYFYLICEKCRLQQLRRRPRDVKFSKIQDHRLLPFFLVLFLFQPK
ncbi:hypothetical protein K443DRAFT_223857 [Laccaria amethystina LaAM-08-1]|uniref:Uncharacterized protein n=1 Tax=Laccaria amethystina LaAM-08-1 TaxID=1095629 RepID=A0A0C9X9B9_9AGAR|nr:hypothetical protein K443DRAFT_223857 [Laccaria amethystina LaAM-08-1]